MICVLCCVQDMSMWVQKSQCACLPSPGGAGCANINSRWCAREHHLKMPLWNSG